jgi:hypothetical protein
LLALLGAAALPLAAQSSSVAPVSIAWADVPIGDALERLANAGPMNLVWDAATLRSARRPRVSCRLTDALPEQVLACITREAGLDWYRLSSGTYVVIARAEAAPGYGALAGYVVDGATGAPIPTARVWLAEAPPPRTVGDDGGFTIDRLLPGRYELMVHAIGYRPSRQRVELGRDARERARVVLEPISERALPIVVNGVRAGTVSGALGASSVADSSIAATIAAPAFFLPGAAQPLGVTRRDGTGDLHLQGGDIGEHPWRLDGVPLFDAAALSGLLGAVAPLAVEQLVIRRAGFRARDGSFAAGAIDLTHAVGDDRPGTGSVTVASDPLAVSARLQAPARFGAARGVGTLTVREGTWGLTAPAALTSAIRAWNAPDAVLLQRLSGFGALPGLSSLDVGGFVPGGKESVNLRDVHAAGRLSWPSLVSVDASFFRTSHAMSWAGAATDTAARTLATTDAYAWRTTGGQIGYRALLGTRVRQHVQARAVRHALAHDATMAMSMPSAPAGTAAMSGSEGNRIEELGLRAEWSAAGATGWEFTTGFDAAQTRASVDLANRVLRPLSAAGRVARLAAWGDVTWPLGGAVFVETGLRVTQLETGRTYAEPRVALRREGGEATPWAWRIAGGGYHQFVSQFDMATTAPMAFVPSVRFWLPMDGRGPVATAWHTSAEAVVRPGARWEFRAEGYARWQPVIPTLDYGALFDAGSAAAPVVTMDAFVRAARGRAAGLGVRALHDGVVGGLPLRVELSYDVGAAQRSFPSRFGGRQQPVPWLEPQRAQVAIDARPVRGLVAALRARGVFGRPWALRQAYYDLFGAAPMSAGLPIDDPGMMRRPALYDLDLGVSYERRVAGARVTVGASVTNVLNRANVLDYGLVRDAAAAATYAMVPRLMPGRMPSVTLRITP